MEIPLLKQVDEDTCPQGSRCWDKMTDDQPIKRHRSPDKITVDPPQIKWRRGQEGNPVAEAAERLQNRPRKTISLDEGGGGIIPLMAYREHGQPIRWYRTGLRGRQG